MKTVEVVLTDSLYNEFAEHAPDWGLEPGDVAGIILRLLRVQQGVWDRQWRDWHLGEIGR